MHYRRAKTPGATYFFTVNLADRNKTLLVDHIDLLRGAIRNVKRKHPFQIDAIVILPDHLHTLWTLPPNDADFSTRWRLIKSEFSRGLAKTEHISASRKQKGERGIWQRRFWEHLVRNDRDYETHVNYIHYNPVKHGHVNNASEWPYSSLHKFIRQGIIAPDWGQTDIEGGFGERTS